MDRSAVFIDGGYLDKVLKKEFGGTRISFEKLAEEMSGNIELLRTYYYHCLPYQSSPPTAGESLRFKNKQRFFNALEKLPRFEVRYGKLEYRGLDIERKPIFIQKRIDLLLGVDLVLLSAKQRITHAMLLAGDSDLIPAITIAKQEGVLLHLYHGGEQNPPHDDLWKLADERTLITQDLIDIVKLK